MSHKDLYYSYPGGSKSFADYNRKKQNGGSKTVTASTSKSPSRASANYNRIVPPNVVNYKNNIRIPYKTEILRQITNGKYGSKTYNDLTKKRNDTVTLNSDSLDPANDFELLDDALLTQDNTADKKPLEENTEQDEKKDIAEFTTEQKDLIDKILATDDKQPSKPAPTSLVVKKIRTIPETPRETNTDIKKLEEKINILTLEIDKLKNNQKNIVRAINRLIKGGSKK